MSKPMIWSSPAIAAVRAAPTMPPAGPDRIASLPWKAAGLGQPAVRLHEIQPHAGQLRRHLLDIAAQDRREIGIDHRGVAARHEARQRADGVAGGDLREADLARDLAEAEFMRRDTSRHASARWRTARMPLARARGERGAGGGLVQRSRSPRHRRRRGRRSRRRSRAAVDGRRTLRSNSRGRAWLPMRSTSAKPRFTSSSMRSPLRSSSALVATVVPIFTASIMPGGIGASSGTPRTSGCRRRRRRGSGRDSR